MVSIFLNNDDDGDFEGRTTELSRELLTPSANALFPGFAWSLEATFMVGLLTNGGSF